MKSLTKLWCCRALVTVTTKKLERRSGSIVILCSLIKISNDLFSRSFCKLSTAKFSQCNLITFLSAVLNKLEIGPISLYSSSGKFYHDHQLVWHSGKLSQHWASSSGVAEWDRRVETNWEFSILILSDKGHFVREYPHIHGMILLIIILVTISSPLTSTWRVMDISDLYLQRF